MFNSWVMLIQWWPDSRSRRPQSNSELKSKIQHVVNTDGVYQTWLEKHVTRGVHAVAANHLRQPRGPARIWHGHFLTRHGFHTVLAHGRVTFLSNTAWCPKYLSTTCWIRYIFCHLRVDYVSPRNVVSILNGNPWWTVIVPSLEPQLIRVPMVLTVGPYKHLLHSSFL